MACVLGIAGGIGGCTAVLFTRVLGWALLNLASLSVFEEDNGLREDNT